MLPDTLPVPEKPTLRRGLTLGAVGILFAELVSRLLVPLFMTVHLSLLTGEISTLGQHTSVYAGLAMQYSLFPIPYLLLFPMTVSHVLEFGVGVEGIALAFASAHLMAIALTFVYPTVVAILVGAWMWRRR